MRKIIALNGAWDFVADLDPKYHLYKLLYPKPDAAKTVLSRRHWLKVAVPGVWQKYGERYDIFEGVCWFAREFEAPESVEKAPVRLRFGGVNYFCRVFINGDEVGSHEGGYTGFTIDLTGKLKSGRNHIAVMVDNRSSKIKWPQCIGYFNYGGIHRGVSLEIDDGPALEDLRLSAVPVGTGWELDVEGCIANGRPDLLLCVCDDSSFSWEERLDETGCIIKASVPFFEVPAWSPDNPHLEHISVKLLDEAHSVVDRRDFNFGFRTVAMKNGKIELNGNPLNVKGICYVYDSPDTGLVMIPKQVETDLLLAKGAGCNAVRTHYPMDKVFYEACDRIGIMAWIEPPIYCYHPGDNEKGTKFSDPECRALASQMALEMIAVARNHPSVIIYGIGNECNTANPEAGEFFRQLAGAIRGADSSRLISYAALYGIVGAVAEFVDVLGINSYFGWYDKKIFGEGYSPDYLYWTSPDSGRNDSDGDIRPEPVNLDKMRKMLDETLSKNKNLALLLTEFGADSVPGFISRSRDLWSENYHAALLSAIFRLTDEYPGIVGTFPFCFSDYRDPSKPPNGYWNELNFKGIVDYKRNLKLAYHAVRARYMCKCCQSEEGL